MDDSEVLTRLESPDNLMNRLKDITEEKVKEVLPVRVEPINPTRGKRGEAVPEKVRELIGSIANESEEDQKEIASTFGVTQALVSQTSRGMVDSRLDGKLAETVRTAREKKEDSAHDLALDAMVASLAGVSIKAASIEDPIKQAKLAESMSRIVGNIKGRNAEDASTKVAVQVVLFQPNRMRTEDEYEKVIA